MVKATGGHFLDAVGHRSHASKKSNQVCCITETSPNSNKQEDEGFSGAFLTHSLSKKKPKITHTISRRAEKDTALMALFGPRKVAPDAPTSAQRASTSPALRDQVRLSSRRSRQFNSSSAFSLGIITSHITRPFQHLQTRFSAAGPQRGP
jgi:hypothetical protein